ncbi:MAG: tetratricopeptide repeat protein [Bacteroidales bacterium]
MLLLVVQVTMVISAQKSRVLSAGQMIDQGKYEEAKETIELAIWNEKTSSWARTYYTRGLLCQTAHEDGFEKREVKKTSLYPDQLYLAYSSYEQAIELDVRKRLQPSISQKYYHLSNDFRKMGQRLFQNGEFEGAFRAFEHALLVNNSNLIHAKADTSLIYNTALAAYESQNWDMAIGYLTGLHEFGHAPATSILLHNAFLENGDSARAEEVLKEGIEIHHYENQVVLYLVNLYVESGRSDQAQRILEEAIKERPENHRFLWTRGLVYIKMGQPEQAIESLKASLDLAPGESKLYYHIGVIYYNMGIDLTDKSVQITNINEYLEMKNLARDRFREAVTWLEKSFEMDPYNDEAISKLYHLYNQLQLEEKEEALKLLLE